MMIRYAILFVWAVLSCTVLAFPAIGQELSDYEYMIRENDVKMAQRPGTERLLHDYLSPALQGEGTVTVFFMIPTACPRCESTVASAIRLIRDFRPQEKVLVVAWHPDAEASNQYIDRQEFGEDYRLIDTAGTFNDVFSTTYGTLQGLLISRVAVREGRMVTGGYFASLSKDFLRDFLAVTVPLPFHVYDEAAYEDLQVRKNENKTQREDAVAYTTREVDLNGYNPGQLRNYPMVKGDELLFLDDMYYAAFRFRQDAAGTYRMQSLLQIDSAKRDTFVNIPPLEYNYYKSLFRYMPLDAIFMPGGGVAMSYSLPLVFIEPSLDGKGEAVGFYNECSFLDYDVEACAWKPVVTFANDDIDNWMEEHFRIFFLRPGYIAMACSKTHWPYYQDESEWGNPRTDPALDGFYDQDNPYFLEMELATGRITKRFGQLDDVFRRTRTGYGYSFAVADAHDGAFIYGNQLTGKLYLTDAAHPEQTLRTYEVFSLGDPPQGDSTLLREHKDEYLLGFVTYFSRSIEQLTLDDRYINCIIRSGQPGKPSPADTYEFVQLSRKSGKVVSRYGLPMEHAGELLLGYGLTKDAKDNRPFYLAKDKGRCFLKFITSK